MKILHVEANGFRGFAQQVRFDFGGRNEIIGGNGKGKSSIMEIVSFTIAGADKAGKERATDRLMNKDSKDMRTMVCMEIDGVEWEIERTAVKLKAKTEGQIYINRNKASQDQIDSVIGNRKHFLASFLPKFFVGLTDAEARDELMQLLRVPEDVEVFATMVEENPEAVECLQGQRLTDPSVYIKEESKMLTEHKQELLRQEGKLEELKLQASQEVPDEIEIDTSEIAFLKDAINVIESSKPVLDDVSELEQERKTLLAEYQLLQKGLSFDESFVECDNCGHKVNLNAEQDRKNGEITLKLVEIKEKGSVLAAKITEARTKNELAEEEFLKDNQQTLSELKKQLAELEGNLRVTEQHNMRVGVARENVATSKNRVSVVREEIKNLNQIIANAEKRIAAAKTFLVHRCELQMKEVTTHLERLSIRLFDVVKSTGEMKPVFKLEYDGKEYKVLSTSEEIRCFLELSKLVRKLSKRDYPVFIDCAESIGEYEQPESQTFAARFINDMPLEVVAK